MRVEIITPDADPDHGGFGARVHSLVRMFAEFAELNVVLTDWFVEPKIPRVSYELFPVRDTLASKLARLRTYYKTDFGARTPAHSPDIVVVESLDVLGLVSSRRETPLLLDEHNVYWDLLEYEIGNGPFFRTRLGRLQLARRWLIPRLLARAKAFEIAAIRRATRTLVTSEADRSEILRELPDLARRIRVLPNCIDAEQFRSTFEGDSAIVLFVGNFNYGPNREAAMFIARELAPALPRARFHLIGANPPPEARRQSNVMTLGYVKDLNSELERAAVCVAPLSHGSGTRLKILTYLAAGKPVVATRKACEGLEVVDGVHALLREESGPFRTAVQSLLEDRILARQLGSAGRNLVEARYDWRVYVPLLRQVVAEVIEEGAS